MQRTNVSSKKRTNSSKYPLGQVTASRARSTANSTARSSMREVNDVVLVSIVENRMKEIGLAVYNLISPNLILSQFADKFNYSATVMQLHLYQPTEVCFYLFLKEINSFP